MTVQDWLGADNEIGIDIWHKKYQFEDETFDEWLDRVSNGNSELRQQIVDKKFLFGGRILANRGLQNKGIKVTYSNCYVATPPEDNIESIFECATKLARTFSYGGGIGVDISKLAPRGAKVNNTAKETSGAVSFMELYSLVTQLIGQNGRRGALMLSIDCKHPDIEEFINIKSDLNKVTKANISIRITDEFMEAVKNNKSFDLEFTRQETGETIKKTINARDIFHKFAEMNWDYAEPGFLLWDRISNWNLLSNTEEFEYAGTNPCAEEPLPAGGSCLLGSINLSEFVINPFDGDAYFDDEGFWETVHVAVKALNEVLDEGLSLHPLQEQKDSVRDWRQIGLGIMGLADMLIKLGIQYGTEESIELCREIAESMLNVALKESSMLAKDFGSFPKYDGQADNILDTDFVACSVNTNTINHIEKHGLRNSQLLTIAPTGTLSTMLNISGGIEPIYANSYTRKTESLHKEGDVYYKIYTPIVKEYMTKHNIKKEEVLPDFFVTAQTLNYKSRIDMQSIWQEYIDASISSTVNVPNDFTVEDVENLYLYAWEKGLKGVTLFRDGCKRSGILTTETKSSENDSNASLTSLQRGSIIQVDDDVIGRKRSLCTGCGTLHCQGLFDPVSGDLTETYFSKGSTGGCNSFMVAVSRLISLASRGGIQIDDIIDQLNSCPTCPSYAVRKATKNDTSKGSSCPMAIGYALKDMNNQIRDELGIAEETDNIQISKNDNNPKCPECGNILCFEGGCNSCKACGYSKCE